MSGLTRLRGDLAGHGLELVRAWPRSPEHLLLHLRPVPGADRVETGATVPGGWVAGQWFADASRAEEVARRTGLTDCRPTGRGAVVLQPGGADRRLPGLRALLGEPGARLVAHRPERRAVVSHHRDGVAVFSKVVPPSRLEALARTAAWRPEGVCVPRVVAVVATGTVTTAALPGRSLHAQGRDVGATQEAAAWRSAGRAVAALHRSVPPVTARRHGPADELAVTLGWLGRAREHGAMDAGRAAQLAGLATEAAARTDVGAGPRAPATLHRDLHDGQVVVAADGAAGLLDLDLLAVGDPALDVANLLVHLRLRDVQAQLSGDGRGPRAPARAAAFLAGYGRVPDPSVLQGLATLAAARVAAVYAFRAPLAGADVRDDGAPVPDVGGVEVGERLVAVVDEGVC